MWALDSNLSWCLPVSVCGLIRQYFEDFGHSPRVHTASLNASVNITSTHTHIDTHTLLQSFFLSLFFSFTTHVHSFTYIPSVATWVKWCVTHTYTPAGWTHAHNHTFLGCDVHIELPFVPVMRQGIPHEFKISFSPSL